jgi:uncharacterized 2Fe-2S/4Fe-4S cluster protein (DUF4445 family)
MQAAPRLTPEDGLLLASREAADGWRLACQTVITGNCRILIPERTPRVQQQKIRVLTQAADAPAGSRSERRGSAGYGAAIDIGTTTVVCYLMDLERSLQVGVASFANPQRAFGPDVISRIVHAHRGPNELKELQRRLVSALDRAVASLCSERAIRVESVTNMTVVGNMTMMHLVCAVDPWPLGVAPYEPVFTEAPEMRGAELGFRRLADCRVHVLPGVGGHLGSDVAAGVTALGLPQKEGVSLFVDLGTNGEIMLCSGGTTVGATSAAGPAFEGVHIHSGMAAFPGAVERVTEKDGTLQLQTIEGLAPAGLCGSGLIDAVALLLRWGFLLPSGRLLSRDQVPSDVPAGLRDRLLDDEDGRRFLLHDSGPRDDIVLTQKDIREVQLAKAPLRAGIDVLLKETSLSEQAIQEILVAGAFGSSIQPESLLALGAVPEGLRGRVHAVGNTAGLGAKLCLTYPEHLAAAREMARNMRHVDLAQREDFRRAFTEHMPFPESRSRI